MSLFRRYDRDAIKEKHLKEMPDWLKESEEKLAEMKPIELIDNVIQFDHFLYQK